MSLLSKGRKRNLSGTTIQKILNLLMTIFALYMIYAILWAYPHAIMYRGIFVTILVALVMIFYNFSDGGREPDKIKIFDYVLSILSLVVGIYIVLNSGRLVFRVQFWDQVFISDIVFGIIMILLVLEATRRVMGWPLVIVATVAIFYPFFGKYIPGMFGHRGFNFSWFIDQLFLSTNGIFSTPVNVVSSYVFMFVLFGEFLKDTGGGDFFFDFAMSMTGHRRGGLAKTAIFASALFGTISGSPISNVATTGAFTIPMMKRSGYPAYFAGAVETAASCGGTIMPPVMGAVAFVMAEVIGVPYYQVAIAAIIPATLYYAAVYIAVDVEAIRQKLKGVSKSELPSIRKTLFNGLQYLFPLIWLVFRLFQGFSPARVAFEAVVVMLVLGLIKRNQKYPITISLVFRALGNTIKVLLPVAIACAASGIIIGVITLTGIGGKFTSIILSLSGGHLFFALMLTMLVTIVLGMGMSITPSYILAASLAGPALVTGGVKPMAAHLFIVYFAAMATMTPPVCLAAYTAAGISESDPMKVGYTAVKLGITAFIIPFVFVYKPELILRGGSSAMDTLYTIIISTIALYSLISGLNRWLIKNTKLWEAALLIIASALMFLDSHVLNLIGIVLFGAIAFQQWFAVKSMLKIGSTGEKA